jgi:N-methylhydantoinase A
LQSLADKLRQSNPEAIAISLLFSFANPKTENAVAAALKTLGLPLSISHQILPEFREYERTSTVVVNAYLQPVMQHYLESLERRARSSEPGRPVPYLRHAVEREELPARLRHARAGAHRAPPGRRSVGAATTSAAAV